MKRFAAVVLSLVFAVGVAAIDTDKAFDDPELQARYERLIAEVRCVTCQNQNIKDSNAFIAADLRREIRRLLEDGKTDAEVADFLVTRYGDFVLYSPRKSGKTLLLWILPFVLLLAGAVGFVRVLKHRASMPIDDVPEDAAQ
ncbi:MAG: cytochrome c-type biogenesis protein [Pseudomonadota bacterium]